MLDRPRRSAGSATSSQAAAAAAAAYPVTVAHAHGETTIEKAPTRIATIGWADADVVSALGVVPVGAPKITWGGNAKGSTDWFDAQAAKLGVKDGDIARYDDSAGIPFDAIAATSPDLILGLSSGVSKEEYDKLTKIAPVVAYTDKPWGTPWEDQLVAIGKALGKDTEAAELKARTDKVIADAIAANPQLKGKSAAWAWFSPTDLSTIGLYTSADMRPQMLREFGLVDSPTVAAMSQDTERVLGEPLRREGARRSTRTSWSSTPRRAPAPSTSPATRSWARSPRCKEAVRGERRQRRRPLDVPAEPALGADRRDEFLPKIVSALNGTPAQ